MFLRLKPLICLSDVPDSLYRVHLPAQDFVRIFATTRPVSVDSSSPASLLAYRSVCAVLAGLSQHFLEIPTPTTIDARWRRRRSP